MDGQSLVTLVDTGIQGPDCLRELIPKIGVRLKVYSYIIKDKEAQASQVSFYIATHIATHSYIHQNCSREVI